MRDNAIRRATAGALIGFLLWFVCGVFLVAMFGGSAAEEGDDQCRCECLSTTSTR